MRRFITYILLLLTIVSFAAEPRLTVVIAVKGLNTEVLDEMQPYWRAGGLRRLDKDATKANLTYSQLLNGGYESLATITTGALPYEHFVSAESFYNITTSKAQSALEDNSSAGIGCSLHLSPLQLGGITLSDEFRMRHNAQSKIYAVGIEAEPTILLAGHDANACAWLNPETYKWASTNYYSEGLPSAADKMNMFSNNTENEQQPEGKIRYEASQLWTNRMNISAYLHPTQSELTANGFSIDPTKHILQSPVANKMVIELAVEMQKQYKLGEDTYPDLLLLQLNSNTPNIKSDMLQSAEQEDLYISLNQSLGYLIEQIEKNVSTEHLRVIIIGYPHYGMGDTMLQKARVGVKYFNVDRAAALINTYLMALYGQERWILKGYGNSIYLNHKLIEQKGLSLNEMSQAVSNFLTEFEGVSYAYPSVEIPKLNREQFGNLQNSYNKRQFGDVVYMIQPNWTIKNGDKQIFDELYEQQISSPVWFYGYGTNIDIEPNIEAHQLKQIITKTK